MCIVNIFGATLQWLPLPVSPLYLSVIGISIMPPSSKIFICLFMVLTISCEVDNVILQVYVQGYDHKRESLALVTITFGLVLRPQSCATSTTAAVSTMV